MTTNASKSRRDLQPGQGVPRKDPEKKKEDVVPPTEAEVGGKAIWQDKPTVADQFIKFPDACRPTAPQFIQFDLNKAGQLEAMNKFFLQVDPPGAPAILINGQMDKFHCSNWIILVKYQRVEYKKLAPNLPK